MLKVNIPYQYKINLIKFCTRLKKSFLMPLLMSFTKMNNTTIADALKGNSRSRSTAIQTWKGSFKTSKSSLDMEVEQFLASAKQFADEFYFEYIAIRTSQQVAGLSNRQRKQKITWSERKLNSSQMNNPLRTRSLMKRLLPQRKNSPLKANPGQRPQTEHEMVKNKLNLVATDRL